MTSACSTSRPHIRIALLLLGIVAALATVAPAVRAEDPEKTFPLLGVVSSGQENAVFRHVAIAPTGRLVAVVVGPGPHGDGDSVKLSLRLYDVPTRSLKSTIRIHARNVSGLAFSPDGKKLAVVEGQGLFIHDVASGRPPSAIRVPLQPGPVAWRADGKALACCGKGEVFLVELADRRIRALRVEGERVDDLAFSQGGNLLAAASSTPTPAGPAYPPSQISIWAAWSGKPVISLRSPQQVLRLRFHPDRKTLVTSGVDGMGVRDITTLRLLRRIGGGTPVALAVSGDGRNAVTIPVMETYAMVYDLDRGTLKGRTRRFGGHGEDVAISPDSRILVAALGESLVFYDLTRTVPFGPGEP